MTADQPTPAEVIAVKRAFDRGWSAPDALDREAARRDLAALADAGYSVVPTDWLESDKLAAIESGEDTTNE